MVSRSKAELYKEYFGRIIDSMPRLIAEGRVPMNVSQLMQIRLGVKNAEGAIKSSWIENYFETGDAIAYKDDKLKVIADSAYLRRINSQSRIENGALLLEDGAYESLEGPEFKRKELEGLVGIKLDTRQAKSHPIWKVLAKNQASLDEYVPYIFAEAKAINYGMATGAMGVFLAKPVKFPTMRICSVKDCSDIDNRDGLGGNFNRVIGIAPGLKMVTPMAAPIANYGGSRSTHKSYGGADQISRKKSSERVRSSTRELPILEPNVSIHFFVD